MASCEKMDAPPAVLHAQGLRWLAKLVFPEKPMSTMPQQRQSPQGRSGTAPPTWPPRPLAPRSNGCAEATHGLRFIYSRGILLRGVFTPGGSAFALTRAPHLRGKQVTATACFSSFSGFCDLPDTVLPASPRSMAVKFQLADGRTTDIVAHSCNGFPCATAERFRTLLAAAAASSADAANPTPLDRYLTKHPKARAFMHSQTAPPASYATVRYFGAHAFAFTNDFGIVTFGRYQWVPCAGEASRAPEEVQKAAPHHLIAEMEERLSHGPVCFRLLLQIADRGDEVMDASRPWPQTRTRFELGLLELQRLIPQERAAEERLVFDPAAVVEGIESADPMIGIRSSRQAALFARRTFR